ncbi:Uncharacterised protein [Paenibacillus macerans]|uniref:Uncharacterized protein n=2 Tax=Paenibacillus macerans TaxID=44252 RepID=A0A090ZGA4_PAEMA|nr:hypothetical protein [Paenibacillus macerans]KFN09438.1 hypothetical protein DJ90_3076 [Paenibacillus macerans]MCY7557750.1 hypothetical protein [Paenibacillus macerans]SUA82486.1 Uncharacterised protein [Paenibacillus macerans]
MMENDLELDFDLESCRELAERSGLSEADRQLVRELIGQAEKLSAENVRLRKALLRASRNGARMSSKLKEALYE